MFGMVFGFQHLYWGNIVMILLGGIFLYLAIKKNYEPLLLVPIGFGMILVNLPLGGLMDYQKEYQAPANGVVQLVEEQNAEVIQGDTIFKILTEDGKETIEEVKVDVTGLEDAWVNEIFVSDGRSING